jgi:alpha-mannosidase
MHRPTIHLICNAHLDPVWQWRWEEGCAETLSTFRTAVGLLDESEDLIFNHNEAVLYRWVGKLDPALFEEIRRLVKAGRWHIAGGWHLQPDVNIPGAESIIRHIAEGRRFFREHFNVAPRVAYNFDSFGHSAGLPQILAKAGYVMYIHQRPQHPDLDLPSDLYRWQGADGTEILGLRISVGLYHTEYDNLEQRLSEAVERALALDRDVPVFWGIGDHGGGATREDLERIVRFARNERRVAFVHSTPERLYEALADAGKSAPVVRGGLQRIFTGCYTSLSRIKRGANASLGRLIQAETMRAAAWWLSGQDYPAEDLDRAWRGHLFNDFHDILPGSCIRSAEQDAVNLYGKVDSSLRWLLLGAAVDFNRGPARATYVPVTALFSSPVPGRVPVEVEFMICHRPKWTGVWHARLVDAGGKEVVCQEEQPEALLPFNGWRRKLCFMAESDGVGVAHYDIEAVEGEKPAAAATAPAAPALDVVFDRERGSVERLAAGGGGPGGRGVNCIAGPLMRALAVEDLGDAWGADVWSYRTVKGSFEVEPASIRVIEEGPVRTIYQTELHFGRSRIVSNAIAYAAWPVLEYRLRIHWNEERMRLKLSVPTIFRSDRIVCEVLGGIAEFPADGEEHVHGRWCMIGGGGAPPGDIALGVVTSGQHGFDFRDGELRLSALRSAAYCHEKGFELSKYPARDYMDQGVHDVRVLVTAGTIDAVRSMLPCLADRLAAPPIVYAHLPIGSVTDRTARAGLVTLRPSNVRMLACKRSWDGEALIVRIQEAAGIPSKAALSLKTPRLEIVLSLKPLEIKTLRIERSGAWREVAMIEER